MRVEEINLLRRITIPLLAAVNLGDIYIKHHHTKDKILLHSFRHRGYWFHGKNRERDTMAVFKKLIHTGDTVVEIGGHIGYVSLLFSRLVGETGNVHVFEPGINNLKYIRKNTRNHKNISLVEKGAGSKNEVLTFYLDDLSGQNNTFLEEHGEFNAVKENSHVKSAQIREVQVPVIPVDDYVFRNKLNTYLIKIDVESYECEVLKGLEETLINQKPIVMVEIAPKNKMWVYKKMSGLGYFGYTPELKLTNDAHDNVFFIHPDKLALAQ